MLSCSFHILDFDYRCYRIHFVLDNGLGDVYVLYSNGLCVNYRVVLDLAKNREIRERNLCVWYMEERSGKLKISFDVNIDYGLLFLFCIHRRDQRYNFSHAYLHKKWPAPLLSLVVRKVSDLPISYGEDYMLELYRKGSKLFCARDNLQEHVCYTVVHEE